MNKKIIVLGSTGSIGTQTLDVARWRGYRVTGLVAGRNIELLLRQVHEFKPEVVFATSAIDAANLPSGTRLAASAAEVAAADADVVVAAIPGLAGLEPVRAAVRAGHLVALANKESMVAAGDLLWQEASEYGADFIPVDSEHSAIFQCLVGEPRENAAELLLTASGGPFREGPEDLSRVTPEQALAHPRWNMGPKVSIDSATLMNKGLEVLEARALFGVGLEQIKVVIHPQSYVHSMVRFKDGQIKAQLGPTDMRLAIQYALSYPARPPTPLANEPLPTVLNFAEPDSERFPALSLAYEAGRVGGVAPVVLNAANEVAVNAFLNRQIPFTAITKIVAKLLEEAPALELTWENLYAADTWTRARAEELI
ncbi:1-deoxy-D-xylulose-5-phosphate reductoisomerase [Oceanithermus sp.]